jgi:hypothetical protein
MIYDLPPKLWLPPKPAIIRAGHLERAEIPREAVIPGLAPALTCPSGSAYKIIQRLGLTSGLQFVLDAGDANSYNASVQTAKWLDLTANGYDFYRGTSTTGDAAEPTFNGTAGGLSSNEYWSVDGGDYFTYDTTNETWMQSLHKDNAAWTFLMFYRPASIALCAVMGDAGTSQGPGIDMLLGSNGSMSIQQKNGTTTQNIASSTLTLTAGAWHMIAVSLNEPAGAGGSFFFLDGTVETFNGTYTSPTTSNAAFTFQLLAAGNAGAPPPSGGRVAVICMWNAALSQANVQALWNALRARFGI